MRENLRPGHDGDEGNADHECELAPVCHHDSDENAAKEETKPHLSHSSQTTIFRDLRRLGDLQ